MTKLLLKIIPFLIIIQSFGQEIDISSSKSELISGIPNYLTVSNKNHKKLRFETDNGSVETFKENQIIVNPKNIGILKVMVFDKKLKIFEKTFKVKNLQPKLYFPSIGSEQNFVYKSDLLKIYSFSVYFPDLICSDFSNTKFKCDIIIKTTNKTIEFACNSQRIPDNLRNEFNTLEKDDEINFKNIIYTVGNKEFYAEDVLLKIK